MGLTVEQLSAEAFARFDGEGGVELGPWSPDAVVLEEPEHLNWYSFVDGARSAWRQFPHVVGIVHTHYVSYAATERACGGPLGALVHPIVGPFKATMALLMSRWMTNGHCHRIVKLSRTLPRVGNDDAEVVSNVHGVRSAFLDVGEACAIATPLDARTAAVARAEAAVPRTAGAYFVGKLLWQKGLGDLGASSRLPRANSGAGSPAATSTSSATARTAPRSRRRSRGSPYAPSSTAGGTTPTSCARISGSW